MVRGKRAELQQDAEPGDEAFGGQVFTAGVGVEQPLKEISSD